MLDVSSFTLTNGRGGSGSPSQTPDSAGARRGGGGGAAPDPIHDLRWKFQDESLLPPPRQFSGGVKRYRAGRGSSVPLDLESLG
jgi:hypothetical protein